MDAAVVFAMHQKAVCYERLNQTQRAIELFQQVVRDFPSTPADYSAQENLKRLQLVCGAAKTLGTLLDSAILPDRGLKEIGIGDMENRNDVKCVPSPERSH